MMGDQGRAQPKRRTDIAYAVLPVAEELDDPSSIGFDQHPQSMKIGRRQGWLDVMRQPAFHIVIC